MLDSANTLNHSMQDYQQSGMQAVMMARNMEEVVAYQLGFNKLKPQGLAVCLACLGKTILACSEFLEVLKDIEAAATTHASKL